MTNHLPRLGRSRLVASLVFISVVAASCGRDSASESDAAETTATLTTAESTTASSTTAGETTTTAESTTTAPAGTSADLTSGYQQAMWGDNVTVTYADGVLRYMSDGLPNHQRDAEYAVPNGGVMIPDASTATAAPDPTKAQTYDYSITMAPTFADSPTDASLGAIGVMISGAALFNPYEGDGATVATQSNFSVKNAAGEDVWFLDDCAGHPNPMGQYHYHALPKCVVATVDIAGGPSHIIGIAFDGFPIYGDRDVDGNQLTDADLDACNGITSPTPEFPEGVYHYVLLDVADSTSSIRCFSGVVDTSLVSMAGMPGMGGMGGPPPSLMP